MALYGRKDTATIFTENREVAGLKPRLKDATVVNQTNKASKVAGDMRPLGEVTNNNLANKLISQKSAPGGIKKPVASVKQILPVVRSKAVKENARPLKRQESTLSHLVKPLSNISVKDKPAIINKLKQDAKSSTSSAVTSKASCETATLRSYSSKQLLNVLDVDTDNEDPLQVSSYIKDIMRYLLELEKRFEVSEDYLRAKFGPRNEKHHTTPKMRTVLVDWLVGAHKNFQLLPETLHMTVAIVDRYLQQTPSVGRQDLQLVGTVALFIAAKYEEMYPPELADLVYICDDTFSSGAMRRMEVKILFQLEFRLGGPLSLHFLRRFNKVAKVSMERHTFGKYLLELALVDYRICHVLPSLQAAAACFLAIVAHNGGNDATTSDRRSPIPARTNLAIFWTKTMEHYTTHSYGQIKPAVNNLALVLQQAKAKAKYEAVQHKYASSKNNMVSTNPATIDAALVKRLAELAKIQPE